MKHAEALSLALEIAEHFYYSSYKLLIVGSIRRGKKEPKDIELLCIPDKLWNGVDMTEAHVRLDEWRDMGVIQPRFKINGAGMPWGMKLRTFSLDGVNVEFHMTTFHQWGVRAVITTGPAEANKALVTKQSKGGCLPGNMKFEDGWLLKDGTRVSTRDELATFAAIGFPFIPPNLRDATLYSQIAQCDVTELWHATHGESQVFKFWRTKSAFGWTDAGTSEKVPVPKRLGDALFSGRNKPDWPSLCSVVNEAVYMPSGNPFTMEQLMKRKEIIA